METKVCTKCKQEYPATLEFWSKATYAKDGFYSSCKKCKNETDKKYRKKNPEKIKENNKKYYKKNPKKMAKFRKKWEDELKDEFITYTLKRRFPFLKDLEEIPQELIDLERLCIINLRNNKKEKNGTD